MNITEADCAAAYLNTLKHRFALDRGKYDEFINVLMEYEHQRFDQSVLVERLKQILEGHTDLLLGLITFLPQSCKVTVPPTFQDRFRFLMKVKIRDTCVHQSFLDIMLEYKKEKTPLAQLYQKVAYLFHNHPDLLREFTQFLPDSFDIPDANQLHLQQEERTSMDVDSLPGESESANVDEDSLICVACLAQMIQDDLKL